MLTEDVTLEVFNHCAGTCTGCMLSTLERRAVQPVMALDAFRQACAALAEHGAAIGTRYRAILAFGDVPWLPHDVQAAYFAAAADAGLGLAATMTLVEADRRQHYATALELLRDHDAEAVFDITVDPVRLERSPDYAERMRHAIGRAPELHLQVLLSEVVLDRYSPERLVALVDETLGPQPVALGFTPTLANLERRHYRYSVTSATDYARRFYSASAPGRRHLAAELERFRAAGDYTRFTRATFHIGADLSIFPVAYTMFGDVIMDARNEGRPLGSIASQPLETIVGGPVVQRLSAQNAAWMQRGSFGCGSCEHLDACAFNGIGLARKLYRDHESKVGSCYGPVEFAREAASDPAGDGLAAG